MTDLTLLRAQFEACADGVADASGPLRALIDATGNGRIDVPAGTYRLGASVIVEHNVTFQGEGAGTLDNARATTFMVDPGVTGFMVRRSAGANYGDNAKFRDLEVAAAGRNSTATTGTMAAGSKDIVLDDPADFKDGDIIMVRGAGEAHTLMNPYYLTAATTAGSPSVTLSQNAGIYPGMVLDVAGAGFPAGTYCVSRSGLNVTMSADAASSVAAGVITYWNDLAVQVMGGGGTTVLTVNEAAYAAVADAAVIHYDCGIYAQTRMGMENCTMRGFQGAGLFIHAGGDVDSVSGRATNANACGVSRIVATANRNGLRMKGNDVNAGTFIGVDVLANTEYGLVDASFLGNYFYGGHASGGYGYMTVFLNASATFVGCYTEGGTYNSFAERTSVIGGAMGGVFGNGAGGNVVQQGTNVITQSYTNFQPSWSDFGFYLGDPNEKNGLIRIDASKVGGSAFTSFKRSSLAGNGQAGLWGWMVDGAAGKCGVYFSDAGADDGAGNAYLLNGYYEGRGQATLTQSNFRRRIGGTAAPTTGTFKRGDIVWNHAPVASGWAGWICVTDGTPGVWKGFGAIDT